jgi:hypothetical protein
MADSPPVQNSVPCFLVYSPMHLVDTPILRHLLPMEVLWDKREPLQPVVTPSICRKEASKVKAALKHTTDPWLALPLAYI